LGEAFPLLYVVSYKLFWNWNGVARFSSQEVWFDKGFFIWHFLNYFLVQIMSLWSLSIGVGIIFTTNKLVDRRRNFESRFKQKHHWKKCAAGQNFHGTKCAAGKIYETKCAAGQNFLRLHTAAPCSTILNTTYNMDWRGREGKRERQREIERKKEREKERVYHPI